MDNSEEQLMSLRTHLAEKVMKFTVIKEIDPSTILQPTALYQFAADTDTPWDYCTVGSWLPDQNSSQMNLCLEQFEPVRIEKHMDDNSLWTVHIWVKGKRFNVVDKPMTLAVAKACAYASGFSKSNME